MTSNEVFAALHKAANEACGARLFTATMLDRRAGLARRVYTSHPSDYPVTGTKPIGNDSWADMVIGRGETFVANKTSEFSPFFSDHELINSLGCEAAVNIPILLEGEVVGTVNILDVEAHFTNTRVQILEQLVSKECETLCKVLKDRKLHV